MYHNSTSTDFSVIDILQKNKIELFVSFFSFILVKFNIVYILLSSYLSRNLLYFIDLFIKLLTAILLITIISKNIIEVLEKIRNIKNVNKNNEDKKIEYKQQDEDKQINTSTQKDDENINQIKN